MTHNTIRPRIVVGVSNTPAAAAALRWALGEARLRDAEVVAVHAWQWSGKHRASYAPMGSWRSPDEEYEAARERARRVVGRVSPGLDPVVAQGPPAQVLLEHGAGAAMLVLGVRAADPGTPAPAPPVVAACVMAALCPVVVISARAAGASAFRPYDVTLSGAPIG
ncbi:universal stress protein [Sphaerisporangium aureirubrum]|uniref:Universal stress protein n=1 Tax=Sphaerisporangium aureirubrum TaxID=1544736 RepID=A0ABW1NR83_9ACTN